MKTTLLALILAALTLPVSARTITLRLTNTLNIARHDVPVAFDLDDYDDTRTALVTVNGTEVPCQLDDFDDDGEYDELAFVCDLDANATATAVITLSGSGEPRTYTPRTYASLSLRDRSAKNPKHLPARSVTVPTGSNPYQYIFPHGPLLESELVGFRIYADHRQSVDFYGHRSKQLELATTAFYPSKEQKVGGYGDDVLYTGSTYGCGTLHGWDNDWAVMYESARSRTYTLLTTGPVRSIIETRNNGWQPVKGCRPVNVRTRYTLWAGHRDVAVSVKFSRDVADLTLSTGVTDIVGSQRITDSDGLLGCWGTACAGNNTVHYDTHTVGLAVCVPHKYRTGEARFSDEKPTLPNQAYAMLLRVKGDDMHYWFTATCDLEQFGFPTAQAWADHLREWKRDVLTPIRIKEQK